MSSKPVSRLPTLRRRLTASLVIVSALPLVIIGLLVNYVLMDIDRQEVMEKNLLIATAFSGEVERFLVLEREALEELLLHLHEERFSAAHQQIYLMSFLRANEAFQRVLVLDGQGRVAATVPRSRDYLALDLSESEGFRSTRSAGSSHLSEVTISFETGEPVAVMTISGTRMTVMGYIDLAALKALNDRIRLGSSGYGIIVDRTGAIIAHRDWQLVQQHANFSRYGFFEPFKRKGRGTFFVRDSGDEEMMSGVLMPDTGWGVFVSQRADEAFAYSRRFLAILFSGLLVSVGMAVVISFITLRRVLVPLASLGERTRQIAKGDYHLPRAMDAAPAYREIADLSHDFQSMIEAVLERQQRLSDSEVKYRTLFEESRDGILIVTYEGGIVDTNRAFVELAGFGSKDELVGSSVLRLYDDPGQRTTVLEQLARDGYITAHEIRLKRRDGSTRHVMLSTTAVRDASGAIVGTRSIVRDMTEQRSLEAQLRQAQKMEAVGHLAGGVAHDFNNILTAIIGYGNLLSMKMQEEDPLRRYVENILESGERAAELTRSLLAFSRKQILNPKAHDLNGIVRDLEKMLKRVIGETVTFSTRLSAGELAVFVDRSQIEQVIMNLVTNARDAMPDGGAISIGTGTAAVDEGFAREHGLAADGAYAVLTVADTGVGMDDDTRANIFEPFFTTKEVGKGTGLGLAIVYGIVTQHGGAVNVYSEPGKGSAFRVYLPKAAAEAGERLRQAEPPPEGGSETILVAEDEEPVRKLISLVLGEAGYTVVEARTGAEALRLFEGKADRIGMVLLDVIMPEGNGKEVYDVIMQRAPGMKVLFMSGYTDDIIHAQGVLDEDLDYIAKPVSPAGLLRKVRDVLDR